MKDKNAKILLIATQLKANLQKTASSQLDVDDIVSDCYDTCREMISNYFYEKGIVGNEDADERELKRMYAAIFDVAKSWLDNNS